MPDIAVALVFFACLAAASLGAMVLHVRLPKHHRADATNVVVRHCANIFVVMTSLVLGLMVNSAKTTFEQVDKNVHAYATELILLDRTLKQYGPEAASARAPLLTYVKQAGARMAQSDPVLGSRTAEQLLQEVAARLRALKPAGADQTALQLRAEQRFEKVYEMRWALVMLLGAWLVLIFASFGYRAPKNAVTVAVLLMSSVLVAGAIYLVLDMDVPFTGTIQVSPAPLERALAEMQR